MTTTQAGAISGCCWFVVLLLLDGGWAMPLSSVVGIATSIASSVGTGVVVAHLFRVPICRARGVWFAILPLATVPAAIVVFTCLIWFARRLAQVSFVPPLVNRNEFAFILGTYAIYGTISLVAPVLWGLAFINQRWFRSRLALRGTA